MTFRAHNRLRRGLRGDRVGIGTWLALIIGYLIGLATLIYGLLFALALFYPVQPALGAETYRVPTACAALAQRNGYPDVLTRAQAVEAKQRLERSRKFWGVALCLGAVNREWKL